MDRRLIAAAIEVKRNYGNHPHCVRLFDASTEEVEAVQAQAQRAHPFKEIIVINRIFKEASQWTDD